MEFDGAKRVFSRLGAPQRDAKQNKVCYHWRSGKCERFPCPFLHEELSHSSTANGATKRSYVQPSDSSFSAPNRRKPNNTHTWGRVQGGRGGGPVVRTEKVCNYWMQERCQYGERCKFVHSWTLGDCFSLLTRLEGHQKAVTGIALPAGSDKLYTGSKDETLRIWDCQSGQCVLVENQGGQVGCMISEGPWVFAGLLNLVKAWNTETLSVLSLSGPVGQVYCLVVGNDLLFAGTQDGSILAWRYNVASNCFEPAAALKGHTLAVVSLVVGGSRIYSGSMDHSIRVWSLENLQCMQTLTDHTDVVMSVLCWDQFLLSCSLDKTIKVWVTAGNGNLEVTYTHNEEHGLLTLFGMNDSEAKPILMCSSNDNSVRVFDLPSFSERGKIFAKQEVRAIQIGPLGLFFTGDGTGEVRVWKWASLAA